VEGKMKKQNHIIALLILFYALSFSGCRDIFGDREQPISIVQPPLEGANISVIEPAHGSVWNPGDTILIRWVAPTIKQIDIHLYRKSEYKFRISDNIINNGNFYWVIPAEINSSVHYRLKVSNHNNSEAYSFSGQFAILN
jgi:hypothetical protein